jgi:hypothetical protein
MVTYPQWLLGRHQTAVTITPTVTDTAGNITPGSSQSLVGTLDSIELGNEPQMENISAMDSTQANWVPLEDDTTITVTEIMKQKSGSYPVSFLRIFYIGSREGVFAFTAGGETCAFTFEAGAYRETYVGKGKRQSILTLRQKGVYGNNPVFS